MDTTLAAIKANLGAPEVLIHNAVGGAFGTFLRLSLRSWSRTFRSIRWACCTLARAVAPDMIAAGKGAIIATGNTSALRGKPRFAGFAPTKAAQRILAESMARSLGPQGAMWPMW